MCCEDQSTMISARETFSSALGKCSMGSTIRSVVRRAQAEKRLTVGLLPAIKRLSMTCSEALFCLMAQSGEQNPATHMHEVLLEAFCFENGIHIVKVDSAEKLHRMISGYAPRECSCVLVHLPYSDPFIDESPMFDPEHLSPPEKLLVEHCENTGGTIHSPIIRLPEQ